MATGAAAAKTTGLGTAARTVGTEETIGVDTPGATVEPVGGIGPAITDANGLVTLVNGLAAFIVVVGTVGGAIAANGLTVDGAAFTTVCGTIDANGLTVD